LHRVSLSATAAVIEITAQSDTRQELGKNGLEDREDLLLAAVIPS